MESQQCECKGTYIVRTDKGVKPCPCLVKKVLQSKLKFLGTTKVSNNALNLCKKIPTFKMKKVVIRAKTQSIEEVRGLISCMWSKLTFSATIEMMNGYRLVEIYLDKDLKYKTIERIYSDILVLTWGYNEFKNSRIPLFINQALESRRDKINWLVYKRNQENMEDLFAYLKENDFKFFEFAEKPNPGVKHLYE